MNNAGVVDYRHPPKFLKMDARKLSFPDSSFDHVNCCISTLSFIHDHMKALSETVRVLRRGGTIFIEVDARWNMDIIWPLVDAMAVGKLGFKTTLMEALEASPF